MSQHARRLRSLPIAPLALLAALTVGVLVLVLFALRQPEPRESAALPTVTPGVDAETSPTDTSPTDDETPTAESVTFALAVPTRLLAADATGQTIIRAEVGSCDSAGRLEVSADGGANWQVRDSLTETGATQVLRIVPGDGVGIQVVALDRDCEPALFASGDAGISWNGPLDPERAWYFDPREPEQVSTPDGTRALPCQAVTVAATGTRAAALCTDETIVTTVDRGETWSDPIAVPGIVALNTAPDDAYVVALAGQDDCEGMLTVTLPQGSASTTLADCLTVDASAGTTVNGDVAVAGAVGIIHIWLRDFFATTDGGGFN